MGKKNSAEKKKIILLVFIVAAIILILVGNYYYGEKKLQTELEGLSDEQLIALSEKTNENIAGQGYSFGILENLGISKGVFMRAKVNPELVEDELVKRQVEPDKLTRVDFEIPQNKKESTTRREPCSCAVNAESLYGAFYQPEHEELWDLSPNDLPLRSIETAGNHVLLCGESIELVRREVNRFGISTGKCDRLVFTCQNNALQSFNNGQTCKLSAGQPCNDPLDCETVYCPLDNGEGICTGRGEVPEGGSCNHWSDCESDVVGRGIGNLVCRGEVVGGGNHFDRNKRCLPRLAEGQPCEEDSYCQEGLECIGRECREDKEPEGSPCVEDSECESNICALDENDDLVCLEEKEMEENCESSRQCPEGARCSHPIKVLEAEEDLDILDDLGPVGDFIERTVEDVSNLPDVYRDHPIAFLVPYPPDDPNQLEEWSSDIAGELGYESEDWCSTQIYVPDSDLEEMGFEFDTTQPKKCFLKGTLGFPCEVNEDCTGDYFCTNGKCRQGRLSDNAECTGNGQCLSGFCENGVCGQSCEHAGETSGERTIRRRDDVVIEVVKKAGEQ